MNEFEKYLPAKETKGTKTKMKKIILKSCIQTQKIEKKVEILNSKFCILN